MQGNYSVHHNPEFPLSAVLVAFGALCAGFDWWAAHRGPTATDQWEEAKRRKRRYCPAWDRVPEQCPCSRLFFGWLSSPGSGTSLKTDWHYEAAFSDKIWRYAPYWSAAVIAVCDPARIRIDLHQIHSTILLGTDPWGQVKCSLNILYTQEKNTYFLIASDLGCKRYQNQKSRWCCVGTR